MNTRTTIVVASILILSSLLAGVLLWNRLPDPVASHWNMNDQVDGYMSRFWGVFMVPLMALGLLLLFLVIPSIDPLKANIARFRPVFNLFVAFITAFMVYLHGLTLAWNLGYHGFRMSTAMLPLMGILIMLAGYLMRTSKRNFFIGIRTPWTLSSDRVWDETHRLGAMLYMATGVLAILGSFFGGPVAFWMLMVPLIGSSLFLVVYSYVLYQRETRL